MKSSGKFHSSLISAHIANIYKLNFSESSNHEPRKQIIKISLKLYPFLVPSMIILYNLRITFEKNSEFNFERSLDTEKLILVRKLFNAG